MSKNHNHILHILLVDDDEDEFLILKDIISNSSFSRKQANYQLDWAASYESAIVNFENRSYDVFLIDYNLGKRSGLDLLRTLSERGNKAPAIMLTGFGNYEIDTAAMQAGASDFLVKDTLNFQLLERSIRYAIEHKQVEEELDRRVQERTLQLQDEINERKQAQDALHSSEIRFRRLAETTSAGIFILQGLTIRYANPAARSITGYDPAELLGQEFTIFVHPNYRDVLNKRGLANPWAPDLPVRYEIKILTKSGEERWLDITAGTVEFEGHHSYILTAFDITERDRAEQELRKAKNELEIRVADRTYELRVANEELADAVAEAQRRASELDALHNASGALLNSLELEPLAEKILDSALGLLPAADLSLLHLVTSSQGNLIAWAYKDKSAGDQSHFKRITDTGAQEHQINFNLDQSYPAKAWRDRLPQHIENMSLDAGQIGLPGEGKGQFQSLIVVPLLMCEQALGCISLASGRQTAFTQDNLRLLQSFADTTTASINNSTLYAEVQHMAVTDPLTGQYNRRGFFEISEREIERFHRFGRPVSVAVIDVDSFKNINDTYGHAAGDQVLAELSRRFTSGIRQVDVCGRQGGDEFAILMPETDAVHAFEVAQRISQAVLGSPIKIGDVSINLSISIGVASATPDTRHLEDLLHRADEGLYAAKQAGRNRVELR